MQKSPIHPFSATIMAWYVEHQRELPWRQTKDPYAIWLSEIILQQTRVAQGLPYFERLITAFPTFRDLAEAPRPHFYVYGKAWAIILEPETYMLQQNTSLLN